MGMERGRFLIILRKTQNKNCGLEVLSFNIYRRARGEMDNERSEKRNNFIFDLRQKGSRSLFTHCCHKFSDYIGYGTT